MYEGRDYDIRRKTKKCIWKNGRKNERKKLKNGGDMMSEQIIEQLLAEIEELKTLFEEMRSIMIQNRINLKQTRFDLWERTSENRQIAQQAKDALDEEFGRKLID